MKVFQGCVRADEVAMTRRGANQQEGRGLTSVLVAKSVAEQPAPAAKTTPENQMDAAELAKAQAAAVTTILSMDEVQKSHYLGLGADAQVAFLAKSADERKTEADAAKAAKDAATAETEAAKAGKTASEVELEKRLSTSEARTAELEKRDRDRTQEAELSKRAREEFDGFPGGEAKVVELLKAYAGLPDAARKASEDVLKSQAEFAKRAGRVFGLSEDETTKSAPAAAELAKRAADLMAADPKIKDLNVAKGKVLREDTALQGRVSAEEAQHAASIN